MLLFVLKVALMFVRLLQFLLVEFELQFVSDWTETCVTSLDILVKYEDISV